ncbi:hypothetical protein [Polycyclovorans algicola]|uniref:hypothetical protein n=1 Tax=Polycyclovorans algicola TaxID=616992 RepID=UPI0004A72240|nr:hypothetical protein [Polycyclovorans algicola]
MLEVAGAGYRKCFEVLIKDFVIWKSADDIRASVIKENLENSIGRIPDEDLVACAKRAAWLANDQVHYAKLHEEHNLPSLKDLIDICADMISKSVRAKNYVQNIAHRKP